MDSVLAAENSKFGVTGELLTETVVLEGTENVARDLWTDSTEGQMLHGVKTLIKCGIARWCAIEAVL